MGSHKAGSNRPQSSLPLSPSSSALSLNIKLSLPLPPHPSTSDSTHTHTRRGEERQGSAGSGLPVLSCERQTFGRVITRRTALGVISDSCLFKVSGARGPLDSPKPPPPSPAPMFRMHLHREESCMSQHKQRAVEAHARFVYVSRILTFASKRRPVLLAVSTLLASLDILKYLQGLSVPGSGDTVLNYDRLRWCRLELPLRALKSPVVFTLASSARLGSDWLGCPGAACRCS